VVHHPFGLERHGFEHPLPPPVSSGHQCEKGVEEGERLTVVLATFRLAQRLAQRVDRLVVTGLGGPHEMGSRGSETPGFHQHPGGATVQRTSPGPADTAVDRLSDQWMVDLVAQVTAVLDLGDQPSAH
jgi:hypothetical protein